MVAIRARKRRRARGSGHGAVLYLGDSRMILYDVSAAWMSAVSGGDARGFWGGDNGQTEFECAGDKELEC